MSHVAGKPCWGPHSLGVQVYLSLRWLREEHSPPGALAQISMTTDFGWRPGTLSARRSQQQKKYKILEGKRAAGEEVKGHLAAPSIIPKFEFTGSM